MDGVKDDYNGEEEKRNIVKKKVVSELCGNEFSSYVIQSCLKSFPLEQLKNFLQYIINGKNLPEESEPHVVLLALSEHGHYVLNTLIHISSKVFLLSFLFCFFLSFLFFFFVNVLNILIYIFYFTFYNFFFFFFVLLF
jgi:hypothetical protein